MSWEHLLNGCIKGHELDIRYVIQKVIVLYLWGWDSGPDDQVEITQGAPTLGRAGNWAGPAQIYGEVNEP